MRRAAALSLLVTLVALVAHAADPPRARKVMLEAEVATADGEPATIWVAVPPTQDDVQKGGTGAGNKFLCRESAKKGAVSGIIERKEQRAPEGALASAATELSEKERADLAAYLAFERGNEPDHELKRRAASIAPDEKRIVKVARAIYDHVLANMKYDKPEGKGWGHGSVRWACTERYGNCTDFHALFMNLCRLRGIPARFTMGVSLPKEPKGKIEGYHCWCEFYVPGSGWVPVDASEAWKHPEKKDFFFGNLDEDRIAFVVGRDLTLEPAQKAGPVSIVPIGYAERDGKPVAIKRTILYEDVK